MQKEKCLECGQLLNGRTDKKYCCDQCRYLHNNRGKIATEKPILEVNKILRANRNILKKLCPVGKNVVDKKVLDAMGYNPAYFSSIFVTAKKDVYYICYDYAFTPLIQSGVKKALIVPRQEFMHFANPWKYVRSKTDQP
jgi:hypothetical protein